MDSSKRVYWRQGVFLQPQHFQIMESAAHERLHILQSYGRPYFWGVGEADISEAALESRRVEIRSGEFVFDDGVFVDFPGNAVIRSRSFEKHWTEYEKPFDVYIGLHKFNKNGANVTEVAGVEEAVRAPTRYVALQDPTNAPDLYGSGPEARVNLMVHAVKIFFETETEQMGDYHVIRLCRLVRDGEKIRISKQYIPPCLNSRGSDTLDALIREIRDLAAARCRVLEQYKSPNTIRRTETDLRYMIYLLALAALNRHAPMLNHAAAGKTVHPWDLYGILCRFIGDLSTFSHAVNAFGEGRDGTQLLPPYDHRDLWTCFSAARKLCAKLLEGIVLGPEYLIPLERGEDFFTAAPPEGVFKPDHAYWLALRTEADTTPLSSNINRHVKLSASMNISTLIAVAVPGAALTYSEEPPSGMPLDTGVYYFKIDENCPQWLEIEKTRTISLFWADAPADLSAEIAVLRK